MECFEALADCVHLLVAALVFALDALELGAERFQPGEMILNRGLHRLKFFDDQIDLSVDGGRFLDGARRTGVVVDHWCPFFFCSG